MKDSTLEIILNGCQIRGECFGKQKGRFFLKLLFRSATHVLDRVEFRSFARSIDLYNSEVIK